MCKEGVSKTPSIKHFKTIKGDSVQMINISVCSLRLVRETVKDYDIVSKKISNPNDVKDILEQLFDLSNRAEEIFVMLCLDAKHNILGAFIVSQGSLSESIVHPREVFKRALVQNSSAIVVAHNHPSGDPTPSPSDIKITKKLCGGAKILDIRLLDHMIIANNKYYSFKDNDAM